MKGKLRHLWAMLLLARAAALPCDTDDASFGWSHAGPGGYTQVGDGVSLASAGAAQAMVRLNGTAYLLATTNGGIWHSADILAPRPHWTQVLDGQPVSCTSISAMEAFGTTVIAGCGSATSSEMGYDWTSYNAGDWGGVMISHNAGQNWTMTQFPANYFVTAFVITSPTRFLVSARAHFLQRDDGGIWATSDGGGTWLRTFKRPVYDMVYDPPSGVILAALPWATDEESVFLSRSGGFATDWTPVGSGITWSGRTPFYPTFALGGSEVFIGALTVNPVSLADTSSAIFHTSLGGLLNGSRWSRILGDLRLDYDAMPKDRMALLVQPDDPAILHVAGNADALTWRVAWATGDWSITWGNDTADSTVPHGDCRRLFWEPTTRSLIMLSDGFAFLRTQPDTPGGRWLALSGDIGAMEFVSAVWDPAGKRWVGGAQDNCAQISPASPSAMAVGWLGGDGTVVAVDSSVSPSRIWGSTQFLGNFEDDDKRGALRGDDDDSSQFGFVTCAEEAKCAKDFIGIPMLTWFRREQMPFFVQPFALLSTDPSQVLFAVRSTKSSLASHKHRQGGIYRMSVPYTVKRTEDILPPVLEVAMGDVYVLVAGGMTNGQPDASVLVGINNTHLVHRSAASAGVLTTHILPMELVPPIELAYDDDEEGMYILGPLTHARTVSLEVSTADSSLLAITGWTSVSDNGAPERVWVSSDAGVSFTDVTTNLRQASATIGQVRPSALLLVPLRKTRHALLVGTVNGVFVAFFGSSAVIALSPWVRLGGCDALPLVLVAGLSYEPKDDTILAATMGRGVYIVQGALRQLQELDPQGDYLFA